MRVAKETGEQIPFPATPPTHLIDELSEGREVQSPQRSLLQAVQKSVSFFRQDDNGCRINVNSRQKGIQSFLDPVSVFELQDGTDVEAVDHFPVRDLDLVELLQLQGIVKTLILVTASHDFSDVRFDSLNDVHGVRGMQLLRMLLDERHEGPSRRFRGMFQVVAADPVRQSADKEETDGREHQEAEEEKEQEDPQ